MIGGIDYTWTAISDKLFIEFFEPESYTPDSLLLILKEIFSLYSAADQIRHIEIGSVPAVTTWKKE